MSVKAAENSVVQRHPLIERLNRPYIDGAFVDALSAETFARVTPVNGEPLPSIASCTEADVDRAVASARRAFESSDWRRRSPRERKRVLQRLSVLMLEHKSEIAALITADMGKPIAAATWEVEFSAEVFEWFGESVDHLYGQVAPLGQDAHATITREPIGVAAAVTPWNFPLLMPSVKLAPALASGNAVVLKPAEQSPLAALRLAELATEAGLPDGVLNVITGLGETAGKSLALHMDVDALGFTGSTSVGRLIMKYAACVTLATRMRRSRSTSRMPCPSRIRDRGGATVDGTARTARAISSGAIAAVHPAITNVTSKRPRAIRNPATTGAIAWPAPWIVE